MGAGRSAPKAIPSVLSRRGDKGVASLPCKSSDGVSPSFNPGLRPSLQDHAPSGWVSPLKALSDHGKSPDQIASRFGVTENLAKSRPALAKTAPELRELFRSVELELSQLAAFTVVDDHARELEVWNNLGKWSRHSATIRRMLLDEQTTTDTPRFAVVGEAAYLEVGGILRKDLFDESGSGVIECPDVLEALFKNEVDAAKAKLLAEGWA